MAGAQRARSAVQRCLPEKVAPELRLKHDLGRISRSRKAARGSADVPATGTGEAGGCARTMASQRADSAIGPQRQAKVRPWRSGHRDGPYAPGNGPSIWVPMQKNKIRPVIQPSSCGHRVEMDCGKRDTKQTPLSRESS